MPTLFETIVEKIVGKGLSERYRRRIIDKETRAAARRLKLSTIPGDAAVGAHAENIIAAASLSNKDLPPQPAYEPLLNRHGHLDPLDNSGHSSIRSRHSKIPPVFAKNGASTKNHGVCNENVDTNAPIPKYKSQIPEVVRGCLHYQHHKRYLFPDGQEFASGEGHFNSTREFNWDGMGRLKPRECDNSHNSHDENTTKMSGYFNALHDPAMTGGNGRYLHYADAPADWKRQFAMKQLGNSLETEIIGRFAKLHNIVIPGLGSLAEIAALKLETAPMPIGQTTTIDEDGCVKVKGWPWKTNPRLNGEAARVPLILQTQPSSKNIDLTNEPLRGPQYSDVEIEVNLSKLIPEVTARPSRSHIPALTDPSHPINQRMAEKTRLEALKADEKSRDLKGAQTSTKLRRMQFAQTRQRQDERRTTCILAKEQQEVLKKYEAKKKQLTYSNDEDAVASASEDEMPAPAKKKKHVTFALPKTKSSSTVEGSLKTASTMATNTPDTSIESVAKA